MDINEDIKKAVEELDAMSEDDELRWEVELRLKGLRDEANMKKTAIKMGREEGMKEGMKEGLKEGKQIGEKNKQIEITKKLLEMKMSIKDIQQATGLTEEEIENINK